MPSRELCKFLFLIALAEAVFANARERSELALLPKCGLDCPWSNGQLDIKLMKNVQANSSQGQRHKDLYLSSSAEWCAGRKFPEPAVHMKLPPCKNTTVKKDMFNEFKINEKGQLFVKHQRWSRVIDDYRMSDNGTTASVCLPLSPQLLQCGLKRLNRQLYAYDDSKLALVNCRTNDTIHIRDYYTSPDSEDIIACNVSIGINRILRCNYVQYSAKEYEFSDDNTSVRLIPSDSSIYQPEYRILNGSDGTMEVCHPMSPEMTTCTLWTLEEHEYYIGSDRRVYSSTQNRVYDVNDYIILRSKVAVCRILLSQLSAPFDVYKLLSILQVLSSIFLFLAFVIHLLVPSLNYHAKPLLCHMFSMVVMYACLACRKLVYPIPPAGCYTLFVFIYFSAMTSFFWLNVLSFDLWSIFANLQTTSRFRCGCGCVKKHNFFYYCLYAYGCPTVMVISCIILDTHPSIQDVLRLHPGVGTMCWFNQRRSAFVLFFGPLFVLLAINVSLFILTVFNLRHASRGVEIVNKKLNKQLLFVCFKIFVIMGLCWIAEAIAFVVGADGEEMYAPDIINAIQGVFLFIIYICKPATYRLLCKKLRPMPSPSEGTWTTDVNSSKGHERFCISCLRIANCEFLMTLIWDSDSEVDSMGPVPGSKKYPGQKKTSIKTTPV